jgi:putative PEP-CTERM system histidine kinase
MATSVRPVLSRWTRFRRNARVFITKKFFPGRYDYREVWLRLSRTLAGRADDASLPDRTVRALGAIIGSPRGELWLATGEPPVYEGRGAWEMPRPEDVLTADHPLISFLEKTHWVLDTDEYASDPRRYAFAFDSGDQIAPSIVVPLVHENGLIGVVRLDRPEGLGDLSFEDHDLLKTAGQQAAIFLVHEMSQEQLAQTRQFEAFSKLTAFLMHDLKNLIAQQDLVVNNAKRFKHRPEFVDDAIRTMEAGVRRMKRVLERLQEDTGAERSTIIDVPGLLGDVCLACSDREPQPRLARIDSEVWVEMDRDRMAITHAIRNAQDATPADGQIRVTLSAENGYALVGIDDDGKGMEPSFVRERLFRPFDSTKGARGMGIGAYQIRETLRLARGDIEVISKPGRGTRMTMKIPLAGGKTTNFLSK